MHDDHRMWVKMQLCSLSLRTFLKTCIIC
jgi:hypothetical protein